MKASLLAVAAGTLVGSAVAGHANHANFHHRRAAAPSGVALDDQQTCGCSTYVTTYFGEPTLVQPMPPKPTSTTITSTSTSTTTVTVAKTSPLPTPSVTVCPTPGTYTFPDKTITVTETTTVCAPTTTVLKPGTQTYGGVTTTVTQATTLTCPYAVVETTGAVTTSVIKTTTYVCPSSGVYTIAPTTTVCGEETTVVYPTPTTIVPGTYTAPAQTITVTATSYVYICPYTQVGLPTSTPPAAPVQAAPTTPAAPAAPVVPSPEPVKEETKPETTKPETTTKQTPTSNGKITLNGNQWAMTYTPYNPDGTCRSKADVANDVAKIKSIGFTTLRLYSTDCSGLEFVGDACEANGVRMIVGIFISKTGGLADAGKQVQDMVKWAKWSLVDIVVIGNECVFGGAIDAGSLASFIASTKSTLQASGCTAKFTTTEPLGTLQSPGYAAAMCSVIDIVGVNIQPFFTSFVVADKAGDFVKNQLELADTICPGKEAYNLECGWPSASTENNDKAIAGKAEQKAAIHNILETVGSRSVIFSYTDDPWKGKGAFGVEDSFGCSWAL